MGTTILGYDPKNTTRVPVRSKRQSRVVVSEHDVVYRCTMVTLRADAQSGSKGGLNEIKKLGPQVVMDDPTAGLISTEEARELIEAINEQLGSEMIQFYPGLGHRHLMVWVSGKSASDLYGSTITGRSTDRRCITTETDPTFSGNSWTLRFRSCGIIPQR